MVMIVKCETEEAVSHEYLFPETETFTTACDMRLEIDRQTVHRSDISLCRELWILDQSLLLIISERGCK